MSVRSIRKKAVQQYYYDPACFPRDKDGLIYVRQSSLAQVKMNIHSFEMQTDKFIEHFRTTMGCTGHIEIIADDEALSGTLDNALVQKVVLTTAAPTWLTLQIEWKMNWETDICYFKAARGTGSQWTAEEEQVLYELYPSGDVQTIMTLLPDRSWMGIINHARVLNIDRVSYSRSPRGVRVEDRMALNDEEFLKAHGLSGDKKVHWFA